MSSSVDVDELFYWHIAKAGKRTVITPQTGFLCKPENS